MHQVSGKVPKVNGAAARLDAGGAAEVEGHRELAGRGFGWGHVGAGGVAVGLDAGEAAGLGLVAVDREGVVAAAARVGDVVGSRPSGGADGGGT
jgi:hypothetical protein